MAAGLVFGAILSAWAVSVVAAYRERSQPAAPGQRAQPARLAKPDSPPPVASIARTIGASLTDPRAASTAYLSDAAMNALVQDLRGQSGKLKAVIRAPNADLAEFAQKKNDRIGLYYLGSWPYENGGKPRTASYSNPSGFIEVTRENRPTPVSEHFQLGDFLTKDQYDVWPKYLLLEPKLLDKLELTIAELEKEGHHVDHVFVMSGFRTPRYNKGGGNTGGRANLSRHMYGDASDVYVDNDRDGQPDDLNGDGHVDTRDAKIFADAAEKVEREYPALVGGIGIYKACCGHGPFTHIDTRGYRARWNGEGAG